MYKFENLLTYRVLVFHCSVAPRASVFEVAQALTGKIIPGTHYGETAFDFPAAERYLQGRGFKPFDPANDDMQADLYSLAYIFYPIIDSGLSAGVFYGRAVERLVTSGRIDAAGASG